MDKKEAKTMTMNPYYFDDLPITGADEEILTTVMVILLGILGVVLLFALVSWILSSLSLHAIAKRRGIRKAWLAWIPIGDRWILGSLADQYQHLIQAKVTARRKLLLGLSLGSFVVAFASSLIGGLAEVVAHTDEQLLVWSLVGMVFSLANLAVSITMMVFYHMCNYDLYRSCNPKNAVTFLVLGIIFPITQPFFYLSCRKKDLGMVIPEPVPVHEELPLPVSEF